ncbi:hypothetical protein F5X99DRAFT_423576 [Biscogniauxia marginata]|nr:hypothetical protein F5X99DRAFT_423576 [Biscogniauxia marginata]
MSSTSSTASTPRSGKSEATTSKVHIDAQAFQPCYMFFYGSLMDAQVLQQIARLPSPPVLEPAWISGWEMKMWGSFPTLIPAAALAADNSITTTTTKQPEQERSSSSSSSPLGSENIIRGVAWKLTTYAQFAHLQEYETDHYEPRVCTIHRTDADAGTDTVEDRLPCLMFAWSGDPNSSCLRSGRFDLELYRQTLNQDFSIEYEPEYESEPEPETEN